MCPLTIAGAVRETLLGWRLGRGERLCALGARSALLRGRSASPLAGMKKRRWLVLALASGLCACATTTEHSAYSVIRSTDAFDARGRNPSNNLYPWFRGGTKPGEIVVSNACGFVSFEYKAAALADYVADPSSVHWSQDTYLVLTGEWCQIRPFVFDLDTLVHYRIWNGARYLLSSAPIHKDDSGSPFVDDVAFISSYEFEHSGAQRLLDPTCCAKRIYLRDLEHAR